MVIRPASDADSDNIKSVVFSVLADYELKPDPKSTDRDLDAIEKNYHLNIGFFGVVETGNLIIATLGLQRVDLETCELRKMYLLPAFRGKGIGKFILEFALQKAQALGYKRIVLETASVLKEAIGLYKKYGFKTYIPEHLCDRCDQAFELYL